MVKILNRSLLLLFLDNHHFADCKYIQAEFFNIASCLFFAEHDACKGAS